MVMRARVAPIKSCIKMRATVGVGKDEHEEHDEHTYRKPVHICYRYLVGECSYLHVAETTATGIKSSYVTEVGK